MPNSPATDHPILMFDGVCNLCNGLNQFVIKRDPPPGCFRFVALQSERGQAILRQHGLPTDSIDTFVMIDGSHAYLRSTAGLHVLRRLGFPWSMLFPMILVPVEFRDVLYDWIAKRRYRWFGRQTSCIVPTPDIRSRFLE